MAKKLLQQKLASEKNIKISKLYHGSTTDINVGRAHGEDKPELEMDHKELINIASTS